MFPKNNFLEAPEIHRNTMKNREEKRQKCMLCLHRVSITTDLFWASVQFSSIPDGIYALAKAHTRSTPTLRRFYNVVFDTVPAIIRLIDDGPLSSFQGTPPSSFRRSMVWCPWLCVRRYCLKILNTSDLPRRMPLAMVALPASLSGQCTPSPTLSLSPPPSSPSIALQQEGRGCIKSLWFWRHFVTRDMSLIVWLQYHHLP